MAFHSTRGGLAKLAGLARAVDRFGSWWFLSVFSRFLAGAAGLCVILLMVITVVDVVCRHTPLTAPWGSGGFEIAELLMAMVSVLAIAFCWYIGGHIRIGLLLEYCGSRGRAVLNVLACLFGVVFVLAIAWAVMSLGLHDIEFGAGTFILEIPLAPFKITFAIVLGHFILVLVRSLIAYIWRSSGRKVEPWIIIKDS